MSVDERETIVRIDYAERRVYVYSTQSGWWAKCRTLGMKPTGVEGEYYGTLCSTGPGVSLSSMVTQKTRKTAIGTAKRGADGRFGRGRGGE